MAPLRGVHLHDAAALLGGESHVHIHWFLCLVIGVFVFSSFGYWRFCVFSVWLCPKKVSNRI